MSNLTDYGRWAVVAGGSDGVGAAFAHRLAAAGLDVVIVARRPKVLEELAAEVRAVHGREVRTASLDLCAPDAVTSLADVTSGLDVGVFIWNVGADPRSVRFLDKDLDEHLSLISRNCTSVTEAAYRFGGAMVARGRGAMVLVTSGAAWAGGVNLATYGATKAFDLILAEALWAEWQPSGVDVLGLVLGATDTPSFHKALGDHAGAFYDLADPDDVARTALDHLADGPTWIWGADPQGGSPFAGANRRDCVLAMSAGRAASDG